MDFSPLGDTAWLVGGFEPGGAGSAAAAALVRGADIEGIVAVVAGPSAIGVFFDPSARGERIREAVIDAMRTPRTAEGAPSSRLVEIPVGYNGTDLEELAALHAMDPAEVVERHTAPLYTVAAIGFAPGFPYLRGLDPALHTPRRATPRTRVPAGSVAIGGAQTGIYPRSGPGGWHVIGTTPAVVFDPRQSPPSLLQVGDQVRFRDAGTIDRAGAERSSPSPRGAGEGGHFLEMLRSWPGTAIRDRGRHGFLDQGVSPAGPLDPGEWQAMQLAVGNGWDAAGIEWVLRGPVVRFGGECTVASNAFPSAPGRPVRIAAGDVVDFSQTRRGCLAVAGGLDVPHVLGSAAKDPSGGFGGLFGRDLADGDILPVRPPAGIPPDRPPWSVAGRRVPTDPAVTLRIVEGPDEAAGVTPAWTLLAGREFHVAPACSRMGWRMSESVGAGSGNGVLESAPVATGSIQIPPDGCPIILGPDRQTIGGYLQAACVAWVDLPLLADLVPGVCVRFERITLEEAETLRFEELARRRMLRAALELKFDNP